MVNAADAWEPSGHGTYRNLATGREISRADYNNLLAREVGFSSYSQYERLTRNTVYREIMLQQTAQTLGVPVEDVRSLRTTQGREFHAIIADMIREGEFKPGAPKMGHFERGRFAEYLMRYWDIPEDDREALIRRLKAAIWS